MFNTLYLYYRSTQQKQPSSRYPFTTTPRSIPSLVPRASHIPRRPSPITPSRQWLSTFIKIRQGLRPTLIPRRWPSPSSHASWYGLPPNGEVTPSWASLQRSPYAWHGWLPPWYEGLQPGRPPSWFWIWPAWSPTSWYGLWSPRSAPI